MRLIILSTMTAVFATGCFSLDGDETRGEEGRSTWQIEDGLCPGIGGGCNLDAVLATGATVVLDVRVPGRDPSTLSITATGPVTVDGLRSTDVELEQIRVEVTATGPGDATISIEDASGEEIDRAVLSIADPVEMECGVVPEGASLGYRMENLLADQYEVTLSAPTADEVGTERDLACRLTDADGEPLLSVAVISWSVVEGAEIVRVDAEPFETDPSFSRGARVGAQALAVGTARVVASYGELEEEFTITVE